MAKNNYDESSIKGFTGLAALRARPGMYIGELGNPAVNTQNKEAIDNALDEFFAGRNKRVQVGFTKDGYYVVHDSGQGVPVGMHKTFKMHTLEAIYTQLHTGGKFGGDAYKISRGCFVGSTEIRLLNGRIVTFKQLYKRFQKKSTPVHCYAVDPKTGEDSYGVITHCQMTKRVTQVTQVTLSDGTKIRSTVDHPYYVNTAEGKLRKVKAQDLQPGMSLAARHMDYDKDGYLRDSRGPVHRHSYAHFNGVQLDDMKDLVVHHQNEVKDCNIPRNLELLTHGEHYDEHPEKLARWMAYVDSSANKRGKSRFMKANNRDSDFIVGQQLGKIFMIAIRALLDHGNVSSETYSASYMHGACGWANVDTYISKAELKAEAAEALEYLQANAAKFRKIQGYLDRISSYPTVGMRGYSDYANAVKALDQMMSYVEGISEADLLNMTPQDFNARAAKTNTGAIQWSPYARLCQYIEWENAVAYWIGGGEPVFRDDLTPEVRHAILPILEAQAMSEEKAENTLRLFCIAAKRVDGLLTEEKYEAARASTHPMWSKSEQLLRARHGICGNRAITKFARGFNFEVVSVKTVNYEKAEPVYGITVEPTHAYLIQPGIYVANTHGVGVKTITALCEDFKVFTKRDGQWWTQAYAKGKVLAKPLKSGIGHEITEATTKDIPKAALEALPYPDQVKKGGTLLYWKPDLEIIGKGAKLDLEWLDVYLADIAYLTTGFHASWKDAKGKIHDYENTEGPAGWIKYWAEANEVELAFEPIIIETDGCDVVIQQTNWEKSEFAGYTNNGFNSSGGNHVDGFWAALADACATLAKGREYDPLDLGFGMMGYINWKMAEPQFNSQTKERLTSKVKEECQELLYKKLLKALKDNPDLLEDLVSRAEARTMARTSSEDLKAIAKLVKTTKNKKNKALLPGALMEATIKPVELFLVEGASAGGHLAFARIKEYQEVLQLQGKILNAATSSVAAGIENKGISSILTAVGYDPTAKEFKSRVDRVYILTDADVDGSHIMVLIITMFWIYMPEFIKQGRLFIVNAPLFFCLHGGKQYTGKTLKEIQAKLPNGGKGCEIIRAKGWGEVAAEWVRYIAMDPKTRSTTQVQPPASKSEASSFMDLVSDDPLARKRLLGLISEDDE